MTSSLPLLLASASPRRRQIMALLGLDFITAATFTDEEAIADNFRGPLEELAQWLAKRKAAAALALPEAQGRTVVRIAGD